MEYDEYTYRISGSYETIPDHFTSIDKEDLPGSVEIVEGSQNVIPWSVDGWIAFYGEVINNTPAYLTLVTVYISAYNTNDALIFEDPWVYLDHLHPGEKATYHLYTDEISLEDLGRYEVTFEVPWYGLYLLPTVVDDKSWGKVKAIEKGGKNGR